MTEYVVFVATKAEEEHDTAVEIWRGLAKDEKEAEQFARKNYTVAKGFHLWAATAQEENSWRNSRPLSAIAEFCEGGGSVVECTIHRIKGDIIISDSILELWDEFENNIGETRWDSAKIFEHKLILFRQDGAVRHYETFERAEVSGNEMKIAAFYPAIPEIDNLSHMKEYLEETVGLDDCESESVMIAVLRDLADRLSQ